MRESLSRFLTPKNRIMLRNVTGAFLIKGSSLLISVLLLPAYLRYFENQTVLGIWYTILSVLSWINLFDLGLGNGLRNRLPVCMEEHDTGGARAAVSTTYFLMGGMALAVGVAGYLICPLIPWNTVFNVDPTVLDAGVLLTSVRIVFAGILLQLVLKIAGSLLYALQKAALVDALSLFSNLIILISLYLIPGGTLAQNLVTMSVINVAAVNLPLLLATAVLFFGPLRHMAPSPRYLSREEVGGILGIGLSLLWLQLTYMVLTSANELVITRLTSPESVVEYQAYYKIFKTAAMAVSLALTPVWSVVTKAQAEGDFRWIRKIYRIFLVFAGVCFLLELAVTPVLPWLMEVWLGKDVVTVHRLYGVVFAASSVMMVLHSVNTSVGNGLSYFRHQLVMMTVAAVLFLPLSALFVRLTGSWIGVVIANTLALLPYEATAPFFLARFIKKKEAETVSPRGEDPVPPQE